MLVRIYKTLNDCIEFKTELTDTREIFNAIKYTHGFDIYDNILYNKHNFIGILNERVDNLDANTLFSDLALYEELCILPVVEGEEAISASMILAAAAAAGEGGVVVGVGAFAASGTMVMSVGVATAIAAVANLAIGIGISMCVSALMSPTNTFGSDPSKSQKTSTMFNSAVTITEQGGSVPLTYGNPFCGGVLISSGLTSTDK